MDNKSNIDHLSANPLAFIQLLEDNGFVEGSFTGNVNNLVSRPIHDPLTYVVSYNTTKVFFDKETIPLLFSLLFPIKEDASVESILSASSFYNKVFEKTYSQYTQDDYKLYLNEFTLEFFTADFIFIYKFDTNISKIKFSSRFSEDISCSGFSLTLLYQSILDNFKQSFERYFNDSNKLLNSLTINEIIKDDSFYFFQRLLANNDFNAISNEEFCFNILNSSKTILYFDDLENMDKNLIDDNAIIFNNVQQYTNLITNADFSTIENKYTRIRISMNNTILLKSILKGCLNDNQLSYLINIISICSFFNQLIFKIEDSSNIPKRDEFLDILRFNFSTCSPPLDNALYGLSVGKFTLKVKKDIELSFSDSIMRIGTGNNFFQKLSKAPTLEKIYDDLHLVITDYISEKIGLDKNEIRNGHLSIFEMINF